MTDELREALDPFLTEARKHLDALDDGRRIALFLSPEQCRRLAAVEAQHHSGDANNMVPDAKLETAKAALNRIADATPGSANTASADRMCSWTRAVARTALDDIEAVAGGGA